MNPTLLAWFSVGAVLIGAVINVLRPEFPLPIEFKPATRAKIAIVCGAVQACLQTIVAGTPWMQAVATAIASVVTALAAHQFTSGGGGGGVAAGNGAGRSNNSTDGAPAMHRSALRIDAAGVTVFAAALFAAILPGCAFWQTHAAEIHTAEQVACAIANAEMPNDKIAELCQIANDIWPMIAPKVEEQRSKLAAERAKGAAEALERSAAAKGCP